MAIYSLRYDIWTDVNSHGGEKMEKEKHVTLKKAKKGQKRPLKWKIKANFRLILMISMSKTWLDR